MNAQLSLRQRTLRASLSVFSRVLAGITGFILKTTYQVYAEIEKSRIKMLSKFRGNGCDRSHIKVD